MWMCLVALLSFHEFGHAWMAYKCGDDTARIMGRMTINPIVHIDPIGTVLIPLAILWLNPGFFIFGWAKPVPVNPNNYENRKRDDILISMAGPAMNVILAILLMAVYRLALELPIDVGAGAIVHNLELVAFISMILCVFNLIPIPPLDGSHVMRHVVGMSEETYLKIAQYGFIILLIAINVFPQLFRFVGMVSIGTIELFKTVLLFQ
ncbi:MAG: site-2 protease family protein [Verrucomicrobiales bacterium]|jgi:Zn-dependent protease|nr:site-2 protease family protein [Verrucomicrobiales bacterium]|tara:strand:+ start:4267 stop:4887 length:621 start_codon:yes stop_codon:yes gene_type:complete